MEPSDALPSQQGLIEELAQLKSRLAELEKLRAGAVQREQSSGSPLLTPAALQELGLIVVKIGLDGKILLFNKQAEEVSGFPAGEVLDRDYLTTLIPPRARDVVADYLQQSRAQGCFSRDFDGVWMTRYGAERLVVWHFLFEKNLDGQLQSIMIFGRDVTDRREAQRKLKEAEEKFRTIFYNSAAAITVTDAEERIVSWNKFAEDLLGMTYEDLNWKPVESLYSKEEWRKIRSYNIRQKGMQHHLETKMMRKDGREVDVDISLSVLKDSEGNITGAIGIARDITERKEAEEKLKLAEEKFRTIFYNSAVAITVTDADERIVSWNSCAEALLGMTREDLCLRPVHSLYPEEEWRKIRSYNIRQKGMPHHLETKMIHKDGREVDVDISISVLRDAESKITGAIGIARDITERKTAELEMRKAKEAALAAAEARSQFLANMSHEIRTPLNGIIGMLELLSGTVLTPEQGEDLELARVSADALLALVNDVLDFSKIEAGKLRLERVAFGLRETLEETLSAFSLRAREKGIELACDVSPRVPDGLLGDPLRLRQVVMNLVGNAIKFTEVGEVVLRVDVSSEDEDSVWLHVAVRDTGIGVPADKQGMIFDVFSQADSSTSRQYGGSGLGLAICSQLVALMGGRVWMESPVKTSEGGPGGPGSTFHFTTQFGLSEGARTEWRPKDPTGLKDLAVLVVDDNPTNLRILKETLESCQMKPVAVGDVASAILQLDRAQAEGRCFEVAIIDSKMPGRDGFALVEEIRSRPEKSSIKLIMLSSSGQHGEAERCKHLGIPAYLIKPVRQAQLFDAIRMVLGEPVAKVKKSALHSRRRFRKGQRRYKILLAEDNLVNVKVATGLLSKQGHTVVVARDGKQAVAAVERQSFDVILMDVQMPDMDGFQATAAIRELEKQTGRRTPIIALTAHALKGGRERCLTAGMDGYVAKPIRPEELYETLELLASSAAEGEQDKARDVQSVHAEPEVYSRKVGLRHTGGDEGLLEEVIAIFLEYSPGQMEKLEKALDAGDAQEVERLAHALKGSTASIGAQPMSLVAYGLECAAKDAAPEELRSRFSQLQKSFEVLCRKLRVKDPKGSCRENLLHARVRRRGRAA